MLRILSIATQSQRDASGHQIAMLTAQLAAAQRTLAEHGLTITWSEPERRTISHHASCLSPGALAAALVLLATSTVKRWRTRFAAAANAAVTATRRRRPKPGRPPLARALRRRVVRMAWDNPTFGYEKISAHLATVGLRISSSSVQNILKDAGVPPAPQRTDQRKRWKHFLAAHGATLASCDFLSVPVWTFTGLKTVQILVVLRLATREVHLAAVTMNPDAVLMRQVARNLTMDGGFLARHGITHLIRDRSVTFGDAFDDVLKAALVEPILTPVAAPNANAHIERWIGSCRRECLHRIWFLGDGALRRVMVEYIDYHNAHRPHQALGGHVPVPGPTTPGADPPRGRIRRRTRLGGLLAWYEREAA